MIYCLIAIAPVISYAVLCQLNLLLSPSTKPPNLSHQHCRSASPPPTPTITLLLSPEPTILTSPLFQLQLLPKATSSTKKNEQISHNLASTVQFDADIKILIAYSVYR